MQLGEVAQVAQIGSSVGTLIAVLCSIYLADKARREVREDRRLRTHPVVVIRPGGFSMPVTRNSFHHRIPGKNPAAVAEDFKDLPADGQRIDWEPFGQIQNVGQGPAIDVRVTFEPQRVKMGDDEFNIDAQKRTEPRYSPEWNTTTAINQVLAPGSESALAGSLCFIALDFKDQISCAEGLLRINYRDVGGREHCTRQVFRYSNLGPEEQPRYLMSFGDILEIP